MTWGQFNSEIYALMPVEGTRFNVGVMQDPAATPPLKLMIRQAVINIQRLVPCYRVGHETIYTIDDVETNNRASVGNLPNQAILRDMWYVLASDPELYNYLQENCVRQPLRLYPWDNRHDLVFGTLRIKNCQFAVAIDPLGRTFTAFPALDDQSVFSLFWDGMKLEFEDNESCPFDEPMQQAVTEFCHAQIARSVENDLAKYASFMGDFKLSRGMLYTDCRARIGFANDRNSPEGGSLANCSPCVTNCTDTESG